MKVRTSLYNIYILCSDDHNTLEANAIGEKTVLKQELIKLHQSMLVEGVIQFGPNVGDASKHKRLL